MENTGSIKITPQQNPIVQKPYVAQPNFQMPNPRAAYTEAMQAVNGVKQQHTIVIPKKGVAGQLQKMGSRLNFLA